jgi:hypothetical protein
LFEAAEMDEENMAPTSANRSFSLQSAPEGLALLAGEWAGLGRGEYPTIHSFNYSESLRFQHDPDVPYLTYEQQTELIDAQGQPIRRSHWEAGVIRPQDDGSLELACVQSGGRVEILRGIIQEQDVEAGKLWITFESELIGNDGRVVRSSRDWRLNGSQLAYEMFMETTQAGALLFHIGSALVRKT